MHELGHRFLLQHQFGILNPLQVDKALWSDLPITPLVPDDLSERASLMPVLVELDTLPLEARVALMDRAVTHENNSPHPYFSALLQTEDDAELVKQRLTERLILRGPDKKVWLRYFDPRVFRHLTWLLRPEQLWFLFRGIQQWSWRDEQGHWSTYDVIKTEAYLNVLRLTPEQWQGLETLPLLNHCLGVLAVTGHSIDDEAPIMQQLCAWLNEAKTHYGLEDETDRSVFAIQKMQFGKYLHTHPHMQDRLKEASRNSGSYQELCRTLDDATLLGYVNTMQQSQNRE